MSDKKLVVVEETGKAYDPSDIELADKIMALKNKGDKWPVIDLMLESWAKRAPEEMQALKIQIDDQRETLVDKEFGQTKGGADFGRRFSLVFPLQLMLMLRAVYAEEELKYDSQFYREFAKRYPAFRIAEKS